MTLEFRETKRQYGRKKIREIEIVGKRYGGHSLVVGVIRPELNEFAPRVFEVFSAEELMAIAAKMGLATLQQTAQSLPRSSNENAHEKRANPAHARTKSRSRA